MFVKAICKWNETSTKKHIKIKFLSVLVELNFLCMDDAV